jgi:hypothetical protein
MTYAKDDFYKYVAPDVRLVPIPTVEDAVEDVIIDFCQKTSIYRQWLEDTISVVEDDTEVELTLPDNTAVVNVMAVQELDDNGDPIEDQFIDPDTYHFSNQDGTPKILFMQPSDEEYDARVRVSLRPVVAFTVVPDWIWEDWRDVIVSGVKYRLLSMRAQAWYSPVEAEYHYRLYMAGVRKASSAMVLETINKICKPTSRYI